MTHQQFNVSTAPFYVVLNIGAGHAEKSTVCQDISEVLTAAGRTFEILRVEDPRQIERIAQAAVMKAQQNNGIVVAVGGDGTLNAVARATLAGGCHFGVIPQGTFNYFGRLHGISPDTKEAARGLLNARVVPVKVGLINDRPFLVNASLGLYPQLLEDREEQKARLGRSRLTAGWAALVTIFRGYRPRRLTLSYDGQTRQIRLLTLFVGNNRLQLEQMGLDEASSVEEGSLVAILVRPLPALSLLWLVAQGAMSKLSGARGVQSFAISKLGVAPANRRLQRLKVAFDGETVWMNTPIEFRIATEPLLLLQPIDARPELDAK